MTDKDELTLVEKLSLLGKMDGLKVEDYDREFLTLLLGLGIPDILDISQHRRRALRLMYTVMFIEIFGDDAMEEESESGEPTLWQLACAMAMHAFLRGYAYGEKGGKL
jgi:hypothetical protein